jgi:hypothetical protein
MPCLGCDSFHKRDYNVEIHTKGHKEMYANIEALGQFWDSIRTMLENNQRIIILEAIGEGPMYQYMARNAGRCLQRKKPESLLFRRSAWR